MHVKGGSWSTHLQSSVDAYNRQFNRGIGYTPEEAVKLTGKDIEKVKENNDKAYAKKYEPIMNDIENKKFRMGDMVRIKINKSKMDKSSKPNWSEGIYKISAIIPKQGTRAEKYRIDRKGFEDKIFTRNDILKVNEVEKAPEKKKVETRATVRKEKEESQPQTRRVTRNSNKEDVKKEPKPPVPPVPAKSSSNKTPKPPVPTVPAGKYRKGQKVKVKYPDGVYNGIVHSSTAKRTIIYSIFLLIKLPMSSYQKNTIP